MYTKDQIIEEAKKLGKMMSETEQVEFFQKAEAKIHENQEIREKMASLKSLQQQAVNFQNYGKERAYQMTEEKLAKIEAELNEMPLVEQFQESQRSVNELLQMVSTRFLHQLQMKLSKEQVAITYKEKLALKFVIDQTKIQINLNKTTKALTSIKNSAPLFIETFE